MLYLLEQNGVYEIKTQNNSKYGPLNVERKACPKRVLGRSHFLCCILIPIKILCTMTLEDAWSSRKHEVHHLRIFGSVAYAKILDVERSKLDYNGVKCIYSFGIWW